MIAQGRVDSWERVLARPGPAPTLNTRADKEKLKEAIVAVARQLSNERWPQDHNFAILWAFTDAAGRV